MSVYYVSSGLCHYGVKGMKWGVRNNKKPKSYSRTLTKEQKSKIKKIAIAATVAVGVGAAAYCLNRYGNANFDKTIKSGKLIQHMSKVADDSLDHPFYASYLKKDNKAYARNDFFGAHWNYKIMTTSTKDIRIAGKKNAEKVYKQWLSSNSEANARFGNQSYFSFNRNLNSPDMRDKNLYKSFYRELEKNGYSAIRDVNDQSQSRTISPLIIFGSLDTIKVSDIRKVR